MSEPAKSRRTVESETPLLEWIAGVVGALLFLAALAVLTTEGLSEKTPPEIGARVLETRAQNGGWLVMLEAENSGDQPAEAVRFVLSLGEGERGEERREVVIDFIGPHSTRRAGVFFASNPAGRELRIEPQGFLEP